PRLRPSPGDQVIRLGLVVLGQALDDVFLGLEVVIQSGLGHAKPLGDLPQRGSLVAVLGEELDCDLLDPGTRVSARPGAGPGIGSVLSVRRGGGMRESPRLPPREGGLSDALHRLPASAVTYLTTG